MKTLENDSVDVVCTDPPYLYLKGQKLEREFDEQLFFSECIRVLKPGGFIVLFGRGTSFYRWNYLLSEIGFNFKEEIIWDKSYTTSSMHPISRHHETISIHCKGIGKINDVRVPYLESKKDNIESIKQDLKRIKSGLNNPKELLELEKFIDTKDVDFGENKKRGFNTTIQGVSKEQCRSVKTLQAITNGMKEKSIIKQIREHYKTIHPTQKPVRLIERLLALVIPNSEKIKVIDPFSGSWYTCEAVQNIYFSDTRREYEFEGWEIDEEYFNLSKDRFKYIPQTQLF
jgi:site-specific DNA-methyltransferase (adenine-specific)